MLKKVIKLFLVLLVHVYTISSVAENIGQLPYCINNSGQGLFIVSTLDGKLSALNSSGSLIWQIDTGPGPLLKSNIHNVELTSHGEWIRIIPSLTGGLYKFNGKTIDAIPITADSLLKSSFFYSNDLVIAGGREVRTYGVALNTGNIMYTCSLLGCKNDTHFEGEIDNVLIIERNTLTVRAHEPRTGNERWNFSVGHHNIKIPSISCINTDTTIMSLNISAVLPEGLLIATKIDDKNEVWKYKFAAPIVSIWLWNGKDLSIIDTFDVIPKVDEVKMNLSPAIYLAMHNKQLYIHESNKMLNLIQSNTYPNPDVVESQSITRIPWKPIPASTAAVVTNNDHDRSTALSVLYNSEYVNGNGYYLFADNDLGNKTMICSDNTTDNAYKAEEPSRFLQNIWTLMLLTAVLMTFSIWLTTGKTLVVSYGKHPSSTTSDSGVPASTAFDDVEEKFTSIYENSFDTVGCLGKGGFGVVFEAKQKIDECMYAIKRITLPNDDSKEHVLREVKALAKLDHRNIVRYYNSWFERPPFGWQYDHDKKWIDDGFSLIDSSSCVSEVKVVPAIRHKRTNSTVIDMSTISLEETDIPPRLDNYDIDISFRDNSISFRDSKSNSISFRNDSNYAANEDDCSNRDDICRTNSFSRSTSSRNHSYIDNRSSSCTADRNNSCNKGIPVYLYIQMQLCKKESLKDWLFANRERSRTAIVPIFKQILNAVEYIHSKSLIHRDLKPNNIFFSMDNDIKVGDFGLVTTMTENNEDQINTASLLQSHTKGAGTELYMSPEQLEKKRYSFKVDIYSLGVILFELLVPFSTEMERFKMLSNLRNDIYPENFGIKFPDEHRLLKKMLSKDPEVRPTTGVIKKTPPFTPSC